MNTEVTLGRRMKTVMDLADEAQRKRALEEEATRNEEALVLLMSVRHFFDSAFRLFEFRLKHDKAPGFVYLGYKAHRDTAMHLSTHNWQIPHGKDYTAGTGIWTPTHKCYPLWLEFVERCKAQDLKPVWKYQYDGAGVESWYELSVVPM